MHKMIRTENAPSAIGPYSQAVQAGNSLYISGQIPFIPETMVLAGPDIVTQTRRSLLNIKGIVEAAGFQTSDIVKCTVFMKDLNEFTAMNAEYLAFFGDHKPARAAVEVARLPKDVKVEIDAICVKS
jgi:2-iminobutanoate/2-iminopropanoate deaminase